MIKTFALGRIFVGVLEPFSDQAIMQEMADRYDLSGLEPSDIPPEFIGTIRDNGDKVRGEPPYMDPKALEAIQNGHNVTRPSYREYPRDPDEPALFV